MSDDTAEDGITYVSFSELETWRQCPHKWKLSYGERWRAKDNPAKPDARSKGHFFHELMEAHYASLRFGDSETALVKSREVFVSAMAQAQYQTQRDMYELVWAVYERYAAFYGADETWVIKGVEHEFRFKLDERFGLKGKVDLIVWDTERQCLVVIDHKSGAKLPKDKDLDQDVQLRLYAMALRALGHDIGNMALYNSVRLVVGKRKEYTDAELFERRPTRFNDHELDVLKADVLADLYAAYDASAHPRHPDKDRCAWMCDFTESCIVGRKSGVDAEQRYMRALGFQPNAERSF